MGVIEISRDGGNHLENNSFMKIRKRAEQKYINAKNKWRQLPNIDLSHIFSYLLRTIGNI